MTDKMKAGDDPADFDVDQVNDHLAKADDDERQRVLDAEQADGAKGRKGILEGPHVEKADPQAPEDDQAPAGDPADVESGVRGDTPDKPSMKLEDSVGSGTVHQEGAPAAAVEAVEESERLGFVAPEQNALKPEKPDYSQANPDVMNGGA